MARSEAGEGHDRCTRVPAAALAVAIADPDGFAADLVAYRSAQAAARVSALKSSILILALAQPFAVGWMFWFRREILGSYLFFCSDGIGLGP